MAYLPIYSKHLVWSLYSKISLDLRDINKNICNIIPAKAAVIITKATEISEIPAPLP